MLSVCTEREVRWDSGLFVYVDGGDMYTFWVMEPR